MNTDHFWSKVVIPTDVITGCWLFTEYKNPGGYGRVRLRGRKTLAHRAAYELVRGPIPEGLTLDHLCRNRICVNPAHLEPVTGSENTRRAALVRTNWSHGEDHGMAKLTAAEVGQISDLYVGRIYSRKQLAEAYGISLSQVHNIITASQWKHLGRPAVRRRDNVKLTSVEARQIRDLCASRLFLQREIGSFYGVHQTLVSLVAVGKAWQALDAANGVAR